MIKIKKTKKQDFQNTINLDSKSQLAKLLATENVSVQHNNVATASFDVANRVLTLPIFKIKDKHVYDMLITHECGHALHTKVDDWSEISSDDRLRMAVNILEDTRIDKIMQNTYPGVINDYKKGFDKLNDSDFYGLQDRDINTLSILDKINMRSKSLERMNITFTDEELKIVKKVDKIKSFDDVVKLAKQILKYQKQKDQEQMMDVNDIQMPSEKSEDGKSIDGENTDGENSESDDSNSSEDGDQESDSNSDKDADSKPVDPTQRQEDETYSEYQDRLEKLAEEEIIKKTTSMAPQDTDDDFGITNQEFEKAVQELTQTNSSNQRQYANLPKPNLDDTIINYKQWLKDFGADVDKQNHNQYKSEMTNRYSKFKKDSMKTVNYLVKEFEMKKSATAYARANTSKTGVIDPMLLKNYKFTDDIFKKLTVIPDAKNHGMIILVDWSGSMSEVLPSVIQQLMNLAWFCRKINIPFEVYAFSNYYRYDYDSREKNLTKSFDLKSGDLHLASFNLVNFISHKMNNKDFEQGMMNLYMTLECTDYRGYTNKTIVDWSSCDIDGNYLARPISLPSCMGLGSTPLNQALATMIDLIPKFKSKYNIEKLSFITLTDGCSDSGEGIVDEVTTDSDGKTQISKTRGDGKWVINVKGKNFETKDTRYSSEGMTGLLLKIIKEKYNTNNIGFYLIPQKSKRHLTWAIDNYDSRGNYTGYDIDSVIKDLTKNNVHLTPKTGYDKYFITVGNTKVQSADMSSLDSDAKTSDIKRLFRKSMTGRLKSRVLLNNFIEEVA